jgi:prepilin-type N-terminal cleavage/methylation domain-containing protein
MTRARGSRAGFSLIETMVGLTLLSITVTTVAALDYSMMSRTRQVASASYANATLLRQVNRFAVLPFDSLPAHAGCVTVASPVPNTACATVTDLSTLTRRVTVVLTLTGWPARPDTVVIDRSSLAANSPVNTP